MKLSFPFAVGAAAAYSNHTTSTPTPGQGGRQAHPPGAAARYKIIIEDVCSLVPVTTPTSTSTIIETYCGKCTHNLAYTTEWMEWCPTTTSPYMTPVTYEITETCIGMVTPTWSSSPGYVPPGYTAEMSTCTECPGQPSAIITHPVPAPTCPGPQCRAPSVGSPGSWGNVTGISPYTNNAEARVQMGSRCLLAVGIIPSFLLLL